MNHLSRLFVLALFLLTPFVSSAQETARPYIPRVLIHDVSVEKATYAQGETVNGSFVITNADTASAGGIVYVVRLVGGYDDTSIWSSEYVTQRSEVFALGPNEEVTRTFSIAVPQMLAGEDFGVEVQAELASGFPLGWDAARIAINGTATYLTVDDAYVLIGNRDFHTEEGPTLHEGQTGSLLAKVKNATAEAITLHPVITFVSMEGVTNEVQQDALTIEAGKDATVSVPLAATTPGVYTATLRLEDAGGSVRAPLLNYRFIVAGATARIQTIATGDTVWGSGDTVDVVVSISGTPPDINPNGAPREQSDTTAELRLTLKNEWGIAVAESSTEVDIATSKSPIIPMTLSTGASALLARAELVKDGKTISLLETPLSAGYKEAQAKVVTLLVLLVIIILAVIAAFVFRKRDAMNAFVFGRASISACVVGFLAALFALLLWLGVLSVPAAHAVGSGNCFDPENPNSEYFCDGGDPGGGDPGPYVPPTYWYASYVRDGGIWSEFVRNNLPIWDRTGSQYRVRNYVYTPPQALTETSYNVGLGYNASLPINIGSAFKTTWDYTRQQGRLTDPVSGNQYVDLVSDASIYSLPATTYFVTPGGWTSAGSSDTATPFIYLNALRLPITPGGSFYIDGTVSYYECTNMLVGFKLEGTFQGVARQQTIGASGTHGHTISSASKRFTLGPFTAPSTPGTYRLTLNSGWTFGHTPLGNTDIGHIDIDVGGPVATLSPSPSSIVTGSSSTLTASCQNSTIASIDNGVGTVNATTDTRSVAPVANTTYTLTCEDAQGRTAQATAAVTVFDTPLMATCTAAPSSADSGQTVNFSSSVSGGTGNYSYSWRESGNVFGTNSSASKSFSSNGTKTITLTVTDLGPAPTSSFSASPTSVVSGNSSTLSWTSSNTSSCTGTGFSTGSATSGSVVVSPNTSTTYSLACTGAGGSVNKSATVTVTAPPPAPTSSFAASPTSITSGGSSTLSWSSTNATSCTGTGFSTGGATSGAATVSPTTTSSYSLSCSGAGGTVNKSATITVTAGGGGGGG
ncbi:MAG TPA: hypothetical protein PK109_02885, partial [Candidatus Paceibacterota bacterium]|nr:hypothetical protein [Candidatus Paceibacterota bacterium]